MSRKKKVLMIIMVAVLVIVAACAWYVNDYYHSEVKVEDYADLSDSITITEIKEGLFIDSAGTEQAIIFYPGAKVEYTSYLPLFYRLAEQGIDCFLVEMPGNLAILGMNKADDIMDRYDYDDWYLSGHSLGGAMAASYTADNLGDVDGLILLAAYPTKSLKDDEFAVLSLYGSEDGVLNMEKLEEGRAYMPDDYTEICIEGGNHAYFGNYGEQDGDGSAVISRDEQQVATADAILTLLNKE